MKPSWRHWQHSTFRLAVANRQSHQSHPAWLRSPGIGELATEPQVQVIASNHYRGTKPHPKLYQLVEGFSPASVTLPVTQPTNSGGQTLELDSFLSHVYPTTQVLVFWEKI
jgi:hypothetical protein